MLAMRCACLPAVGIQYGICVVPPLGAGVWIEFEQGDPDYPIWTGGFWGSAAEVPALMRARTPVSPGIVMQTVAQNTIAITDVPPQILIKVGGSTIMLARLSDADVPALAALRTRNPSDPSIAMLDAGATLLDLLTFYQDRKSVV